MNKLVTGVAGSSRDRGDVSSVGSNRVMEAVRAVLPSCMPLFALSGVVISTLPISQAYAETATASGASDELDEVVVTGLRRSVQTSQDIKKNSEVIVDSISAVDIGALPDRSVTEAIQRIPGVTIDHLFAPGDTNRFSAEGSGVAIRGMTQVRSELNGEDVFSAKNTRGLSFEDVPSELMAGVDVFKNPSADMIEGGLGGTVNLRTRKPFDSKGLTGGVTASVNYGDFIKKTKPQASLMISDRWDTAIGEIGALVDIAYSGLGTRTDSIQFGRPFRRKASDVNATGKGIQNCQDYSGGAAFECVYIPNGARWSELDFDRKRQGFDVVLQWKPNQYVETSLSVMQSDYKMDWTEHSAWFQDDAFAPALAPNTNSSFDSNGVFQSGTLITTSWIPDWTDYLGILGTSGARVDTGTTTRMAGQHQKTTNYAWDIKVNATEKLALSGSVVYISADANNHDYTVNTESDPGSLAIDLTGELPSVVANPAGYMADKSKYYWAAGMDDTQQNRGSELAAKLDLSYEIDTGWFKTLRGGLRFTNRNAENKDTGYNWQPISEWWMFDAVNNVWPGHLASMDQYLPNYSTYFQFSNFFRGKAHLPSGIWVATDDLVRNLNDNGAIIKQAEVNGSGWAPDTFMDGDTNIQHEKTYAGYLLLKFGGDVGKLPLDGNIGMRVVGTYYDAAGFAQQPDWTSHAATLGSDFVSKYGSGKWLANSYSSNYVDALPSLNLRLKFTPELQWRFAVSRAVSRPTFDQLSANVQLGGTITATAQPCVTGLIDPRTGAQCAPLGEDVTVSERVTSYTGSGGNPTLKPMRATQLDTALEWYFAPQGSLFGTLFYKDVNNYFIRGTETEKLFGLDWQVSTTVNGDHGVIKGFEVGYSQFYDFLPSFLKGLGAQANFTYIDSRGGSPTAGPSGDAATVVPGLPIEGLSKTSYNLVAMYQRGLVEARLAYNWRERFLLTTHDGDGKGSVWNDNYGQLDGSFFVHINSHLQVGLEANNLTNTTQKLLVGPFKYTTEWNGNTPAYDVGYTDNRLYKNAWYTFDRRYALSVKYTF